MAGQATARGPRQVTGSRHHPPPDREGGREVGIGHRHPKKPVRAATARSKPVSFYDFFFSKEVFDTKCIVSVPSIHNKARKKERWQVQRTGMKPTADDINELVPQLFWVECADKHRSSAKVRSRTFL